MKHPIVIAHELVSTFVVLLSCLFVKFNFTGIPEAVVENITVEIAVQIVVKKSGMRSITTIVQVIRFSLFAKG